MNEPMIDFALLWVPADTVVLVSGNGGVDGGPNPRRMRAADVEIGQTANVPLDSPLRAYLRGDSGYLGKRLA